MPSISPLSSHTHPLLPLDAPTPAEPVESPADAPSTQPPERPLLTPPNALPFSDHRLLGIITETSRLGNQLLDTLNTRLSGIKSKIREISAENIQKLQEAAERAEASDFWSLLKKVATCLISVVSMVFGVALLGSGGGALIGGSMIASGILSLANFTLLETGGWDWVAEQIARDNEDLKAKLRMILPGAVGMLAAGIGIAGSVKGIASGAIQFGDKVGLVIEAALATFDGITTFGKGYADAKLLWVKAEHKLIDTKLTIERERYTMTLDEIKSSLEEFKAMNAKSKKAIDTICQLNIQSARQA